MAASSKHVFEATRLAGLELENRLVRSATWEGLAHHDGTVTPPLLSLYAELARGGVGLVISSYLTVHEQGRQNPDQIGAHQDEHVPGLKQFADQVHQQGRPIVGQVVHCGGQSSRQAMGGLDPLAPSAVASPGYPEVPRELGLEQIETIVQSFADAAGRLQQAGFDGVQLHGAHGYLLGEFLSPTRNQRSDRYGGSLESRARFGLEVYQAVRERVGPHWPVFIKLNANDFMDGSTTEVDAAFLARELVAAGLDAIEISGGTPGSGPLGAARARIPVPDGEAYFLPQARLLRAAVPEVPLILVGGLRSLDTIERVLREGVVDYVAMSRPLIREPDLPRRWQRGERAAARCVSCLGCFGPARRGEGIRCVEEDRATPA